MLLPLPPGDDKSNEAADRKLEEMKQLLQAGERRFKAQTGRADSEIWSAIVVMDDEGNELKSKG